MASVADRKTAWVVGATSFLGRHVARQLAHDGMRVIAFGRRALEPQEMIAHGITAVEIGEFVAPLLAAGFDRHGPPAVVFHAIGSGSVGQAAADTAADTVRTVQSLETVLTALATLAPRARLIYPSSAAVYGDAAQNPISEEAPLNPISDYGRAKVRAEELCTRHASEFGLDVVIARLFSVYGPLQRKLLVWELAQRLLSHESPLRLGGTGHETRDFLYVGDAAAILARLAALPSAGGTFNIGTGVPTSTRELAEKLAAAIGVRVEVKFSGQARPGDPIHQRADPSKLLSVTGLPFTSLAEGLVKYAQWLRGDGSRPIDQPLDAAAKG